MKWEEILPGDCLTWHGPYRITQIYLVLTKPRKRFSAVTFWLVRLDDSSIVKGERIANTDVLGPVWSVLRGGEELDLRVDERA